MPKRIIAAILLFAFTLASCRTWTQIEGIPDPMPDQVRVELLSGERIEVTEPRLEADTLVGLLPGTSEAVRVPLGQVEALEGKETKGLALLVVVVPIAVLTIAVLIFQPSPY